MPQSLSHLATAINYFFSKTPESKAENKFNKGKSFFHKKDYDCAINAFTNALQLDPTRKEFFLWRGIAHFAKGDQETALKNFFSMSDIDVSVNPYAVLGNLFLLLKNIIEAIKAYEKAWEYDPANTLIHKKLTWMRHTYFSNHHREEIMDPSVDEVEPLQDSPLRNNVSPVR